MTEIPSIDISLNGHDEQIPAQQSLAALLQLLSIGSDRVAIEMDRQIVHKRDWANTIVNAGAQIEIVEFVGGG